MQQPGQGGDADDAEIERMRQSKNPYVKAYGNQLLLERNQQRLTKPAEFGVIGRDPYGNDQRGWIDAQLARAERAAGPARTRLLVDHRPMMASGGSRPRHRRAPYRRRLRQLRAFLLRHLAAEAPDLVPG